MPTKSFHRTDRVSAQLRRELGQPLLALLQADHYASYVWDEASRRFVDGTSLNMDAANIARYESTYQFLSPITARLQARRSPAIASEVYPYSRLMHSSYYADFLARANPAMEQICPGARIVAFGHMGDGNFHYTVMQPEGSDPARFPGERLSLAVYEIADALGGSISAEHGIGVARTGDLARFKDPDSLALMRAVKRALDPDRIMNPRALIP